MFDGALEQGGWMRGQAPAGTLSARLGEQALELDQDGRFFAAFDRDAGPSAELVATIESRQGMKVACPEEIALGKDWIDIERVERTAHSMIKTGYGQYLQQLISDARKQ